MSRDPIAYKVLTGEQLATLESGSFAGAPVDVADGYIHLSTAEQLTETVDKHFAGQSDLHVAAIDLEALGDDVKWEESRGGQQFPHIYGGPLLLEVVLSYGALERDEAGKVKLPVAGKTFPKACSPATAGAQTGLPPSRENKKRGRVAV
jgi:uncharacterized protein (DUF952 family)